jgi:hypothetical protein
MSWRGASAAQFDIYLWLSFGLAQRELSSHFRFAARSLAAIWLLVKALLSQN